MDWLMAPSQRAGYVGLSTAERNIRSPPWGVHRLYPLGASLIRAESWTDMLPRANGVPTIVLVRPRIDDMALVSPLDNTSVRAMAAVISSSVVSVLAVFEVDLGVQV